jgi:hypothetical protein
MVSIQSAVSAHILALCQCVLLFLMLLCCFQGTASMCLRLTRHVSLQHIAIIWLAIIRLTKHKTDTRSCNSPEACSATRNSTKTGSKDLPLLALMDLKLSPLCHADLCCPLLHALIPAALLVRLRCCGRRVLVAAAAAAPQLQLVPWCL